MMKVEGLKRRVVRLLEEQGDFWLHSLLRLIDIEGLAGTMYEQDARRVGGLLDIVSKYEGVEVDCDEEERALARLEWVLVPKTGA